MKCSIHICNPQDMLYVHFTIAARIGIAKNMTAFVNYYC